MIRIFFLFLFVLNGSQTIAQSYNYTNYTTNDGLPSSEVYHVMQDSKGYIWFATDNGVSRFNGYEFENFSTKDGLPDNTIFEIYEDFEGKLWFISSSAKLSYFHNNLIHLYEYNDVLLKKFLSHPIHAKRAFYIDTSGTVFFGDRILGIIAINEFGELLPIGSNFDIKSIGDQSFIHTIRSDNLTQITINLNDSILNFSLESPIKKKNAYYRLSIVTDSLVFLAYNVHLICFNKNGTVTRTSYDESIIWLSIINKNLWVGTNSGIYQYGNPTLKKKEERLLLRNLAVTSVLKDNENGYWFTTLKNGVYYLKNLNIYSLLEDINEEEFWPTCIEKTKNKLLYGTNSGKVGVIDNMTCIPKIELISEGASHRIEDIVELNTDIFYAISNSALVKWKYKKNKFHNKYPNNQKISDKYGGKCLSTLGDTAIIYGGRSGIGVIQNEQLKYWQYVQEDIALNLFSIFNNENNNIILGTHKGLWKHNLVTLETTRIEISGSIDNDRITTLSKNKTNHNLLVGTKSNGVVIINDSLLFKMKLKELENISITKIYEHNQNFYISTKGQGLYIYKYNQESDNYKLINNITYSHGILSNDISDCVVTDSLIFITTNHGINIIDDFSIQHTSSPSIYMKSLQINGYDTIIQSSYNLPYDLNSFGIILTGLAYKLQSKVNYKYRLLGNSKDTSWIHINNRQIQLSYIPPGKYTFQAKALNENNVESKTPVEFKLRIRPPFWKTWWFISILILGIIGITSLFMLYLSKEKNKVRIKEINERNELEKEFIENKNKLQQEIEKHRQQALSQQMNPHFIFNSLNSIQYFIYQNEKELSNKYLTKFSRLIRIILENSSHQLVSIKSDFEALQIYLELEEMRLQGKLEFTIRVDDEINTDFYKIPPLLIQPFAENAIWHGIVNKEGDGKVLIHLKEKDTNLLCIVEDDGIGRENAKKIKEKKKKTHTSLGSSITERRLELLINTDDSESRITYHDLVVDGKSCGTKVVVRIPKIH